ncbi:uncharacterized protein LOC119647070 [Hermetia illucens]|uniref:uncharacterized protein LOC119647070 n=1 Tax=Hermetia illucens TaxID=343691 RepID=UPI0018CC0D65|nr:uncharacterized protein LOC119647070 [Hermetia illucens]
MKLFSVFIVEFFISYIIADEGTKHLDFTSSDAFRTSAKDLTDTELKSVNAIAQELEYSILEMGDDIWSDVAILTMRTKRKLEALFIKYHEANEQEGNLSDIDNCELKAQIKLLSDLRHLVNESEVCQTAAEESLVVIRPNFVDIINKGWKVAESAARRLLACEAPTTLGVMELCAERKLITFQKIKKDFILTLDRDHDAGIEKMKTANAQFKECLQVVEEKSTNSQNETFAEILKCQRKYDGR